MNDDVQTIKDRLNIVDVVGTYVPLQKAGRNFRARCPFHKERTPSFMVSPERGTYVCFGCGEKGDIFSFVEKIDGVDFQTALRQLAERAGVELKRGSAHVAPEQKEHIDRLRDACEAATVFFEEELMKRADVGEYIRKRGVTDTTRAHWRIGYAPALWRALADHLTSRGFSHDEIVDAGLAIRSEKRAGDIYDRFRGRIMFPIADQGGRIIAFSGRFFEKMEGSHEEGEPAKYVNSPETELFKKSRVLYGFDKAKEFMRKADCVMLVEGQFDVVMSHQSGLPCAVAVSGTALTDEHLALIGRMSKRLVLSLDSDAAGLRAGLKSAAMALALGFDVKVPHLEGGKDPADIALVDPENLRREVRNAVHAVPFFLDVLRAESTDERVYKKAVGESVVPLLVAIQNKIDQAHFVHMVADRLQVPDDAVRFEVERASRTTARRDAPISEHISAPQETTIRSADMSDDLSPLDKRIAMLAFHPVVTELTKTALRELVGNERYEQIQKTFAPYTERLCFELDELGNDVEQTSQSLIHTIEQLLIDERITAVRRDLSSADPTDLAHTSELNKKLTELARQKHTKNQVSGL